MIRGGVEGAYSALVSTFALLVAIRYFDASTLEKSIIAGALPLGMLLSLFYAGWSPFIGGTNRRSALPSLGVAAGLLVAAWAETSLAYTIGMTLMGVCFRLPIPIMTGIYRTNYRGVVRGQVFGISVFLTAVATLLTSYFAGHLLDWSFENYRLLFTGIGMMALVHGFALFRIPASPVVERTIPNPFSCFGVVKRHPLFGYMLTAWFLFGVANLGMFPQRVEYLSRAEFGIQLSPWTISMLLGVLPEMVRMPMIPVWARLFDRFHFIKIRMVLNCCLLGHLLIFYQSKSIFFLGLGTGLLATSLAGGAIAWNLWVTKFARPEETSRYMAVHTFLTGVRGTFAPYLGYLLVDAVGIQTASMISAGLVLLSILMLAPVRNLETRK
jgi:MFS family permease